MKKIIIFVMLLIVSAISISQPTTNTVNTDYLQKGLHQRHAANAMLWGGMGVFFIGMGWGAAETGFIISTGNPLSTGSQIVFYTGLISMIGSIPLFIAYHRNKKKSSSISLGNESIPGLRNGCLANRFTPALFLKIGL